MEGKIPIGWRKAKGTIFNGNYADNTEDVFFEDAEGTPPVTRIAEVYINDENDIWFETFEEMMEWIEDNNEADEG